MILQFWHKCFIHKWIVKSDKSDKFFSIFVFLLFINFFVAELKRADNIKNSIKKSWNSRDDGCATEEHLTLNIANDVERLAISATVVTFNRERNRSHWNSTSSTSYLSFALFTLTCRAVCCFVDRLFVICRCVRKFAKDEWCFYRETLRKFSKHHWKFSNFKEVKFLSIFQFFFSVLVARLEFFRLEMKYFDPHFSQHSSP